MLQFFGLILVVLSQVSFACITLQEGMAFLVAAREGFLLVCLRSVCIAWLVSARDTH